MTGFVWNSGQWRAGTAFYARSGNVWRTGKGGWVYDGGWKPFFRTQVDIVLTNGASVGPKTVSPGKYPSEADLLSVTGGKLRIYVRGNPSTDGIHGTASPVSVDHALEISGWPSNIEVELHVEASIVGYGGDGGDSGSRYVSGKPGADGGPALLVQSPITLYGTGIIGGGGGGGGGGGAAPRGGDGSDYVNEGGGGGGGAGSGYYSDVTGGLGGDSIGQPDPGNDGADGSRLSGGAGGAGIASPGTAGQASYAGDGGDGGNLGQAGDPGEDGFDIYNPNNTNPYYEMRGGAGGAPGVAIVGMSNVTIGTGSSVSIRGATQG